MARSHTRAEAEPAVDLRTGIDANAIVSFNLRFIRQRRGFTQEQVARKLGALTGHRLPQASISAMERGFDSERRRRFDAHELYLLALVFEVPITYFFAPPPDSDDEELVDSRKPVSTLISTLLGTDEGLERFDERLSAAVGALAPDLSPARDEWMEQYREWRRQRLLHLATKYADDLDRVADLLVEIGTAIQQSGPRGFLQSRAGDPSG